MKLTNDKSVRSLLYIVVLLAAGARQAAPQSAVFFASPPIANTVRDGNSSLPAPFFTPLSARFQQVYSASGFSDLNLHGGGRIQTVVFRVDANLGYSFDTTINNVRLTLSTTSRGPDGLSSVFADNIGADNLVVLGPGSRVIGGAGGGGITGFNVAFSFVDNPFFYNPANGNLLIDLEILTGAGGTPGMGPQLDAFSTVGDEVSSVFAYGSTLPTTGQASTLGLATAFSVIPVPEPSTWALLAAGLGTLFAFRKRTRKGGRDVLG